MAPIDLVRLISEKYPAFFKPWQERIADLPADFAEPIVQRIPDDWMSETSKEFALAFVAENRKLILEIK